MSKMHCFSNKILEIAKRWELSAPAPHTSILVTWSYVIWPNCGFLSWLWRNGTFKKSVTTSFSWHRHHYVTEKRHQNNVTKFSILVPSQSKFSGYSSVNLLTRTIHLCFIAGWPRSGRFCEIFKRSRFD